MFEQGFAYLFELPTGREIAKLVPDDGGEMDSFGKSVALHGDRAFVGAPFRGSGAVYVFSTVPEPPAVIIGCVAVALFVSCARCHRATEYK